MYPGREGDITGFNTDKANTVLGWSPPSLEEAMSAWKWEQKVREQKQNNNKKCAFESYFNSLVQKL
jgi:hypothetical protein